MLKLDTNYDYYLPEDGFMKFGVPAFYEVKWGNLWFGPGHADVDKIFKQLGVTEVRCSVHNHNTVFELWTEEDDSYKLLKDIIQSFQTLEVIRDAGDGMQTVDVYDYGEYVRTYEKEIEADVPHVCE